MGDKTTLSGREFQVLTTRWEKKCASRAEGVKRFANFMVLPLVRRTVERVKHDLFQYKQDCVQIQYKTSCRSRIPHKRQSRIQAV